MMCKICMQRERAKRETANYVNERRTKTVVRNTPGKKSEKIKLCVVIFFNCSTKPTGHMTEIVKLNFCAHWNLKKRIIFSVH